MNETYHSISIIPPLLFLSSLPLYLSTFSSLSLCSPHLFLAWLLKSMSQNNPNTRLANKYCRNTGQYSPSQPSFLPKWYCLADTS